MTPTLIHREDVLAALSKVQEPELHKDLVTLNMIQDIEINESVVKFRIVLTTPACPLKGKIEKEARDAVMTIQGVKTVNIVMDANVPADGRPRGNLSLNAKNVVAVASGKGGVGKSTVAVNLAVSLAQSGAKVGLLDADIYGPNIPTMMGVDRLPAFEEGKIIPAVAYGVKLMSIGFLVQPGQPLIWRGPMLHSAIRQFLNDVEWGDLDYLVIDLPPGTGDAQLSLAQSIPISGGVIVTLPQAVSLEDASRGLYMFRQLDIPILGVIENMSFLELPDGQRMDVFGSGGGEKLAKQAGTEFFGCVPMAADVRIGGDSGRPIVLTHPDSGPGKALREISEIIAARLSVAALKNDGGIKLEIVG
ncbi:MAG: chromosome partitioning protein [Chloroflexi bacterium HGW-Chloroflexi-10]|nr:MAG: chromosome partitioning protein [Chloroflexi bacterium HGW-Chloroflexi-10]